jgi:hypothetical protein
MYMISEPGLRLSERSCQKIRKAGQAPGFSRSVYSKACGLTSHGSGSDRGGRQMTGASRKT